MKTLVDKSLVVKEKLPCQVRDAGTGLHLLFSAFACLQTICVYCSNFLGSKSSSFLDFENH